VAAKVRLTIDVSEELNRMLETIARDTGTTKTDVFRKAMALMDVAHQARKKGKRVGIAAKGQPLETEFVGLWGCP
jgi:predicted transcriptional regulator